MSRRQASKKARQRAKQLAFAKKSGRWDKARLARPGCPTPAKRIFGTEASARAEARGKGVYRCPCGGWHLTTKNKSFRPERGAE